MTTPRFFDEHGSEIIYTDVPSFTETGVCRNCGKTAPLDIYPAYKGCCEECKWKGIYQEWDTGIPTAWRNIVEPPRNIRVVLGFQ